MPNTYRCLLALLIGLTAVAGCSQQQQTASEESRIVEDVVALTPATVPVTIGPLTGELTGLSVMRRVDESTGEVTYAPQLSGTLLLRNTSEDTAVRLISGDVTYVNDEGARIPVAEDRHDTTFDFPSYSVDRLDPGDVTTHTLDVPFPAAALDNGLSELRLGLEYLPMPYREQTVTVDITIGARG